MNGRCSVHVIVVGGTGSGVKLSLRYRSAAMEVIQMTESVKDSSALPVQEVAYLPNETAARMVAGLKRAFSTPPTMHEERSLSVRTLRHKISKEA